MSTVGVPNRQNKIWDNILDIKMSDFQEQGVHFNLEKPKSQKNFKGLVPSLKSRTGGCTRIGPSEVGATSGAT